MAVIRYREAHGAALREEIVGDERVSLAYAGPVERIAFADDTQIVEAALGTLARA